MHEGLTLTPGRAVPRLVCPFSHVAFFRFRAAPDQEIQPIMKSLSSRLVASAVALAIAAALIGATTPARIREPGKLIILSTTDVKGKNEPCG